MSFRIRRIDLITEPALDGVRWDYADTFEVLLDQPDDHPAEQWLRAALEQSSGPVRHLIPLVHRNIVRFNLDLDDPDNLLGWRRSCRNTIPPPSRPTVLCYARLLSPAVIHRRVAQGPRTCSSTNPPLPG